MGVTAVTVFDWSAAAVLAVSALFGLARGGAREIAGLLALALATIFALASDRLAGGVFATLIHPAWLARPAGMAAVFLLTYIVLRLAGGALSNGIRGAGLGGLDRLVGFGLGFFRGVVALGLFALVLGSLLPPERTPGWIGRSRLYPLAQGAGAVIRDLAPPALGLVRPDAPTRSDQAHSMVVVEDAR